MRHSREVAHNIRGERSIDVNWPHRLSKYVADIVGQVYMRIPGLRLTYRLCMGAGSAVGGQFGRGGCAVGAETNLIEDDRPVSITISDQRKLTFEIRPNGVKTIRVQTGTIPAPPRPEYLVATPVSDMQVELSWETNSETAREISHYDVYRLPRADAKPGLRYYVGRSTNTRFSDQPRLNYGGWLNNRLQPSTHYHYTVRAVDRYNNHGPFAELIESVTLNPEQKNLVPNQVEGLYVVQVSPSSPDNYLNLWFYSNCESDILAYEIHRSTQQGFDPGDATLKATLELNAELSLLNRQMYTDRAVEGNTTYYYRICAIDNSGQKGPFSDEVNMNTK